MKALTFLYQDSHIHFLLNPMGKNVMVNATEMAKLFDKRTDHYLQNESTKVFIEALKVADMSATLETKDGLKVPDMSGTLESKIIDNRGRNGIYFCELLAIDFATWLDVGFKIWVYQRIQEVVFGNYKKHWEAYARQEQVKIKMEALKKVMLSKPTPENVLEYFEYERDLTTAKNDKTKAIRNQLRLYESVDTVKANSK